MSIVGCPVLCLAVKENEIVLINFLILSIDASSPVSSDISRIAASAGVSSSFVCHFGNVYTIFPPEFFHFKRSTSIVPP